MRGARHYGATRVIHAILSLLQRHSCIPNITSAHHRAESDPTGRPSAGSSVSPATTTGTGAPTSLPKPDQRIALKILRWLHSARRAMSQAEIEAAVKRSFSERLCTASQVRCQRRGLRQRQLCHSGLSQLCGHHDWPRLVPYGRPSLDLIQLILYRAVGCAT